MKNLSLFALGVLLSAGVMAQHGPKLGIKGGLNLATLNSTAGDISPRLAPHIGLTAHIHLSDQIAFQPEILYSGQGMEQKLSGSTFKWNLDYINVPLMFQYMFDNGFRIEAGPQIGFLASAKIKGPSATTDIKDDLKKIDAALGFGLSYLTDSGLGIGGRYNLGLTDLNDAGTNSLKNRVAQISLFYLLDNDHKRRSR